jgi:hypothetical protein
LDKLNKNNANLFDNEKNSIAKTKNKGKPNGKF